MKIYFVAGEMSGDNHGAELLRELRARNPRMQFFGRGGPKMRGIAGEHFRDWTDQAAVVGLWEVLKRYPFFRREFANTIDEIVALRADAVVLIDYPGFNLRLAHALRKRAGALKIIYYISPQVWAWNQRRVSSMARSIDLMLCIFPFEPELYKSAGLRAVFVGHPMTFAIRPERPAGASPTVEGKASRGADGGRDEQLIAMFPGSRQREVKKNFPIMLAAARELWRSHPHLRFEVAAASEPLAQAMRLALGEDARNFPIRVGHARDLMMRSAAGMIASGTATLEAALVRLPFVLVYRVAWLTYIAARLVVKVRWLGMPNVLANREIVPEFIQHKARPKEVARAVTRLLEDESSRAGMLAEFDAVNRKLSAGEASSKAAETIAAELSTILRASPSEAATEGRPSNV